MKIIGISGKIGTGKSALGGIIAEKINAKRLAFGDFLKNEVANEFNFDIGYCYSQPGKDTYILHPSLPNGGMVVRQILQWYGQLKRNEDPTYWSRQMQEEVQKLKNNDTQYLVIDDVRYPDEARLVMVEDGLLIRLEPYLGWKPGEYAHHESETALDNWKWWDLVWTPGYGELPKIASMIVDFIQQKEQEAWG